MNATNSGQRAASRAESRPIDSIAAASPTAQITSATYEYDAVGNRTRKTLPNRDEGYGYDLLDRPVACRWKLLYGNRETTVERIGDSPRYRITVPWDDRLPQGRTAIGVAIELVELVRELVDHDAHVRGVGGGVP